MNTFGLIADTKTYFDVQLSFIENSKFIILIMIILIIVTLFFFNKKSRLSLPLKDELTPLFIFSLPVCVIVNLFGNAGYKFVFNFFPIFLLLKILSFKQKFYIFSIFYFIPIYALLNLPNNHTVFSPSILYILLFGHTQE